MELIDIKAFRKANNLTQNQLGVYLGVDKGFISAIEHGKSKFPKAKLTLLLNNPHNWDVSMLTQPKNSMGEQPTSDNGYIRRLKEELDEVKAERDALLQEIAVLKYQLAQKGGIAPSAGDSLSASAV